MFDPRFIWMGIAVCVAAYLGYNTLLATGIHNPSEPTAYITVKKGVTTQLVKINRRQCLAKPNRLWARADDYTECIAYLTPRNQPKGSTAVVFFSGDVGAHNLTAKRSANLTQSYQLRAEALARAYTVPVYIVARPGLMGSSGSHILGGQRDESEIIASAVSLLKQRHGLTRLVLGGQSGGARLVAQLLVSGRRDIGCAVMASGAYGVPRVRGGGRRRTDIWGNPGHRYLVPLRAVSGVVQDRRRRLFVVGDPRDKRAPFSEQRQWAEALQRAGHRTRLLEAAGGGKEFHFLTDLGMRLAGLCAAGRSTQSIANYARSSKSRAGVKPPLRK